MRSLGELLDRAEERDWRKLNTYKVQATNPEGDADDDGFDREEDESD